MQYGVVPCENSVSGTLRNIYDLLTEFPGIQINGEYTMREEHCLVAPKGVELKDIKEVRSHTHLLAQCDRFLTKLQADNGGEVARVAMADSTASCKFLQDGSGGGSGSSAAAAGGAGGAGSRGPAAAVASKGAAAKYGLEVLATGIGDHPMSETRYLVLANEPASVAGRKIPMQCSIAVSLRNETGAMFKALSCFALRNIAVSKVESRPALRAEALFDDHSVANWEYVFYLDFEPSPSPAVTEAALANLKEYAYSVRIFGTYPRYTSSRRATTSTMWPGSMGNC